MRLFKDPINGTIWEIDNPVHIERIEREAVLIDITSEELADDITKKAKG